MSDTTNETRAPDKRRGKTKNAFALRNFDYATLFDFNSVDAIYAGGNDNAEIRQRAKKYCLEGLYKLSESRRHIVNHLVRLSGYRRALDKKLDDYIINIQTQWGRVDVKKMSSLVKRIISLIHFYEEILRNVDELNGRIEALITDIELVEKRDFRKVFSERLRIARKTVGLTQDELAQRIGVKRSTYGQFEQGRNEPNVSLLPKLSRELNRSVEWLIGMTP